jgi:uncharacterized protein (TIGR00369 family)
VTAPPKAQGRRGLRDEDAPNFSKALGVQRVRMAGGECVVRLPLREDHFNLGGVVHGGVTAALLDSCMGGAVVSTLAEDEWCGTASLTLHYLRWGEGAALEASAKVVKRGRALAFVEGAVRDAHGKEVARASGVWFVWRGEERPPGPPEGA